MADTFPRLLGDIGGTNARFGWLAAPGAPLSDIHQLSADSHAALIDAMRHYLRTHAKPAPRWCAIGIATAVIGDRVQMTNHPWSFSISELKAQLGVDRMLVINDFTALALALPVLPASELRQVGGGHGADGAPIGLIGPGTGLGVSGLIPTGRGQGSVPIDGEGGHVTLAATDEREQEIVALLRRRFGHASAERALSGPGLVNLHQAVCELAGEAVPPWKAAEITQRALSGSDSRCVETVDLFFSFLGTVAGNLALSLGARAGVYVGGGIVPRLGHAIDRSRFRSSFESKGRFRDYLAAIPTFVVQPQVPPALVGAARALEDLP